MKRSVGTWLLGSVPLLLASALGGCYSHHTADEELLDIEFPEEAYPDAGAPAKDAGPASRCTQTDPIQLLICQFTSGATGLSGLPGLPGTPTGTGQQPNLGAINDLIGQFFGGGLTPGGGTGMGGGAGMGGGTGMGMGGARDAGMAMTPAGLQGLIDLLGQLGQMQGQGQGQGQNPLQDIIGQVLGRRDAGTPMQPAQMPSVTREQCAAATDISTRVLCLLSGFPTPPPTLGGARDGGAGLPFPFPFPTGRARDAGVADAGEPIVAF